MGQVARGLRGDAELRENSAFSEVPAKIKMAGGRKIQWLGREE